MLRFFTKTSLLFHPKVRKGADTIVQFDVIRTVRTTRLTLFLETSTVASFYIVKHRYRAVRIKKIGL